MDWLITMVTDLPPWFNAIAAVVTAATAVTALTPTRSDDKFLSMVSSVLNFLSGNFGHNKNKDS
jgi:hypothetical protein